MRMTNKPIFFVELFFAYFNLSQTINVSGDLSVSTQKSGDMDQSSLMGTYLKPRQVSQTLESAATWR